MIERAWRMYPKRRKLLEILANIDTTAYVNALKVTAEAMEKFANAWEAHIQKSMEEQHGNDQKR